MKATTLPGFKLAMGWTLAWLGLIVLLPLAGLLIAAFGVDDFWRTVWSPRAVSAYGLTFGAALAAAAANGAIGLLLAWVLVRFDFPGKRLIDSLIDIPFALPTAVTGLAFAVLFRDAPWLANSRAAIVIVLVFISLPFVVRTLQPLLEELGTEAEEAARSLGASRWQTFRMIMLPCLLPALLTGVALAFARAVGEYGSIIFVSGNIPNKTEIAPLLIVDQLEQFHYAGAAAIAVVLLGASFAINGIINVWAARSRREA